MEEVGEAPAHHLVPALEDLTKLLRKCRRAFSLARRRLEACWGEEARWPRKEPCGEEQRVGGEGQLKEGRDQKPESRRSSHQQLWLLHPGPAWIYRNLHDLDLQPDL